VALAALCVGFLLYLPRPDARLYAVLAAAALVRETGLLLVIAYALWSARERRVRRALGFLTAAVPCLAWYAFVHARTAGRPYPASFLPLSGILTALTHPVTYDKPPLVARLNQLTDALALLGILLAFVLALRALRRQEGGRRVGPPEIAGLLFAALGLLLQRLDHWQHVFDFGRVYSPLLLFLGAGFLGGRGVLGLVPTLLLYPRIGMQLGSQAAGVLRGLLRSAGLLG
jgi:hypothetical protein